MFVLSTVFLLLAITVTIAVDTAEPESVAVVPPSFVDGGERGVVLVGEAGNERSALITRLQQALARGEGLSAGEPVFTSVDTPAVPTSSEPVIGATLTYCGNLATAAAIAAGWPADASVTIAAGRRVVRAPAESPVGTTTVATPTVLLDLPLVAAVSSDVCLDHEAVGVSAAGDLLLNSSASQYAGASQLELIGYARDGFPIYGPRSDGVALDQCGGVTTPAGYQYHVQPNIPALLTCYRGLPAPFLSQPE